MADVDNSAWDGAAAMSDAAASDDPAAAYAAICAGRKEGDPAVQSSWALPHHKTPGAPPNADGTRNALSRLPQAEGLTNRDAAEAHLRSHMDDISPDTREVASLEIDAPIQVRDASKRELDIRIVPWDVPIETVKGREQFARGAFTDIDPASVFLMGMNHEATLGIGQDGQPTLVRRPLGRGRVLEEKADAAYMTFKVVETGPGDDLIAYAREGIASGASIEFSEIPGGTVVETRDGRRTRVHRRVNLRGVSTTHQPAYKDAGVIAVRQQQEQKGAPDMAEATAPQTTEASVDTSRIMEAITALQTRQAEQDDRVLQAVEKVEERYRSAFTVPASEQPKPKFYDWMSWSLRVLRGDPVSPTDIETRELQDVITPENPGLVPTALINELIGVVDDSRPFLQSTRQLTAPESGTSVQLPVLTQRATADVQEYEKADIASQALKVTSKTFDGITIAGGADVSYTMIKRATRTFFDLLQGSLAEAYAAVAESKAIDALLSAYGGPADGGALDPENLLLGEAWKNSIDAYRKPPDTIWLGSSAVQAFIDAKANGSNMPLYSDLAGNISAGTGAAGVVSGLRPVYVPELDSSGVDVIVGPSRAYAWAEDGTFTLQVDVPSKAGRDIALVGFMFFMPIYPEAFTTFTIGS